MFKALIPVIVYFAISQASGLPVIPNDFKSLDSCLSAKANYTTQLHLPQSAVKCVRMNVDPKSLLR